MGLPPLCLRGGQQRIFDGHLLLEGSELFAHVVVFLGLRLEVRLRNGELAVEHVDLPLKVRRRLVVPAALGAGGGLEFREAVFVEADLLPKISDLGGLTHDLRFLYLDGLLALLVLRQLRLERLYLLQLRLDQLNGFALGRIRLVVALLARVAFASAELRVVRLKLSQHFPQFI